MTMTTAGAKYNISAYPWNEQAYNSYFTEFSTDISVRGKTVLEMCVGGQGEQDKNLQSIVNQRFVQFAEKNGDPQPDIIGIVFPKDSAISDGTVQNEISDSSMGFDTIRTAPPGTGKENQVYDSTTGTFFRNKLVANPTNAEFKFSQGSDLINAINQIIIMSEFGRRTLEKIDNKGMVTWWKIETQYFQIDGPELRKKDGSPPSYIIFKIVPYKVHISKFSSPNAKLAGKENLDLQALKEYNYIYTGKNVDILNFNIKFDYGFYSTINADSGLESGDRKANSQLSNSTQVKPPPTKLPFESGDPTKTETPSLFKRATTRSSTAYGGGGGRDDAASLAARQFFDVVTSPASMVQLEMSILGDPYFLGDSGLGNYSAKPTELSNMTSDGAVNWQNGEVDVNVTFENPIDPTPATGLYSFPSAGKDTKAVQQVSGLYKVYLLESNFNQGKFTQNLTLTRRLHQFSTNAEGKPVVTPAAANADSKPN
jgi:hypothetical protein